MEILKKKGEEMMKKFWIFLLTPLMLLFPGAASVRAEGLNAVLVVAGAFGDRSFYDSSKAGLDRLIAEKGVNGVTIECNNENHDTQLRNAAEKADVVIAVGWEFYNIEEIAPDYPEVKFIWIDNASYEPVDNLLNITYAQNEGSFLAGYIAAAVSKSGMVGAVGGEDADTINDFIVGYKQGAEYYGNENGKEISVEVSYTDSYDDPALGKDCAIALNDKGVDVIFNIASAAGDGIFEAGGERGFYAIGVDSDQKYIAPDVIIASMKKEVGDSIFDAVSKLADGDDSQFGTTWVADMATGYIGIGYGESDMPQQVPDEVKDSAEVIARKIIDGEIVVETTRG